MGLIAADKTPHRLNQPARVFHMTMSQIESDEWSDGMESRSSRIDASGVMEGLDPTVRAAIIDRAVELHHRTPSALGDGPREFYWLGDPDPDSHPLFPGIDHAYAFSCATFAAHCYEYALPADIGGLVRTDRMPEATDEEYATICAQLGDDRSVQQHDLRRLYPGYLMRAFDVCEYPFDPPDWIPWRDHGIYIPR